MTSRASSRFAVALAALLATSGCGRTSDTASSRVAGMPTASPRVPKIERPLPQISDLDARVTSTKNGVESSMGSGVPEDFGDIGLPVYPALKPQETYVIKHSGRGSFGMTIQGTLPERAEIVDAWYATRLGPSFTAGHTRLLGGEVGTFSRKRPGSNEEVLVQAERDRETGREATTLTLTVTKRR